MIDSSGFCSEKYVNIHRFQYFGTILVEIMASRDFRRFTLQPVVDSVLSDSEENDIESDYPEEELSSESDNESVVKVRGGNESSIHWLLAFNLIQIAS